MRYQRFGFLANACLQSNTRKGCSANGIWQLDRIPQCMKLNDDVVAMQPIVALRLQYKMSWLTLVVLLAWRSWCDCAE
jgi:hypothetical protein